MKRYWQVWFCSIVVFLAGGAVLPALQTSNKTNASLEVVLRVLMPLDHPLRHLGWDDFWRVPVNVLSVVAWGALVAWLIQAALRRRPEGTLNQPSGPYAVSRAGQGHRSVKMMKARRALKWIVVIAAVICLLILGFVLRYPPDPLVYCQKLLDASFEQWMLENRAFTFPAIDGKDKELPNVEGKARDSLALLGLYMPGSYAEGVLRDYGYVPGLRQGDPNDLVMMYLKKMTRRHWNGDFSGSILRDPKWMVIGPDFWDSAGHNEGCYEGGRLEDTQTFKIRLLRTLEFLKENNRPYWTNAVKEHMEFLRSIGESEVGASDVQQIKEMKERSQQKSLEASRFSWGGEGEKTWRYRMAGRDGNAVLDLDGLVIIFKGVPFSGLSSGGLQVSGGGASSGSVGGSGGPTLGTSYKDGIATLTFAGHSFKFLDEGRMVAVGTNQFQIGDSRPTLIIAEDGAVTLTNRTPNKVSGIAPAAQVPH